MSEKIKIDKDFLKKVLEEQSKLKERVKALELEKEKRVYQNLQHLPEQKDEKFNMDFSIKYFGEKDILKEQQFQKELKEMMKKYRVFVCQATLIKVF